MALGGNIIVRTWGTHGIETPPPAPAPECPTPSTSDMNGTSELGGIQSLKAKNHGKCEVQELDEGSGRGLTWSRAASVKVQWISPGLPGERPC